MIETAKVLKLEEGNHVLLQKMESEECKSCKHGYCTVNIKSFPARISHGLHLSSGDLVKVEMDSKTILAAIFLIFIWPLITFLLGFAFIALVWPKISEGFKILGGFGGLALGFLTAALIGRLPVFKQGPLVLEKISAF